MRCIRVVSLDPNFTNKDTPCAKYYDTLFKELGMDNAYVFWTLEYCDERMSAGKNLAFYGIPIEGAAIIQVIELDDTRGKVSVHDYYDWSDFVFFMDDGDEANAEISMECIKKSIGTPLVKQVIFHESAIKTLVCHRTDNVVETWRELHRDFVEYGGNFEIRDKRRVVCENCDCMTEGGKKCCIAN